MIIEFTPEMLKESRIQTDERMKHLKPWFKNGNLTKEQGHQVGFLGEFAACEYFDFDWKNNIRDNYNTFDSYDIMLRNAKVDIKTETLEDKYFKKLQQHVSDNNKPDGMRLDIENDLRYGRRLINGGQRDGLVDKHVILFGAINRDDLIFDGNYLKESSGWLPLGYITAKNALIYPIRRQKPFYSKEFPNYPTDVMAIRSSDLLSIDNLMKRYQAAIS